MRDLFIDIETYSGADISTVGSYRYGLSPDFEILLFAYAFDEEDVRVVDLAQGEDLPEEVIEALDRDDVTKHAYNAAFEWWCLTQAGYTTPLRQWHCTMVHGLYCGYPAGLEAIGHAIGLPEDKKKLATGKALIRYFCSPCRGTRANGGRTRNLPKHAPEKWQLFKEYNAQDVVTERELDRRLRAYPVPDREWSLWRQDIAMNARGVKASRPLIEQALLMIDRQEEELKEEARRITGLANPNSPAQLREWLADQGLALVDLTKATVAQELAGDCPANVRRVLEIRQMLGKTSVKKYDKMLAAMWTDDRIRGISQFYGAGRTGRWAGRLVQMQNLPRNNIKTLDSARRMVISGNYSAVKAIYGDVADTLSQLIRTAFIPEAGNHFVVADFSAIEARVIAWMAGEEWVNEVFATTGKIYEATAAQMFHVPVERIQKGNPEYELRQKGKIATLALGYQGGTGAMITMGALKMGLTEEELPEIVSRWRAANPHIVELWRKVEEAAVSTVETGREHILPIAGGTSSLTFSMQADIIYGQSFLTVRLPSGRSLYYVRPTLKVNKFDRLALFYESKDQTTGKWGEASTYGGKLTENIVQAVARDCLAETLLRIEPMGDIVFHVHDEVVVDAGKDLKKEALYEAMAEPIEWAPGLILKGAGFEGPYYQKD